MTTISRRGFCRALAGAGAVAQMSATARGEEKAPPSCSWVTSSPVTDFTTLGPVRNM